MSLLYVTSSRCVPTSTHWETPHYLLCTRNGTSSTPIMQYFYLLMLFPSYTTVPECLDLSRTSFFSDDTTPTPLILVSSILSPDPVRVECNRQNWMNNVEKSWSPQKVKPVFSCTSGINYSKTTGLKSIKTLLNLNEYSIILRSEEISTF